MIVLFICGIALLINTTSLSIWECNRQYINHTIDIAQLYGSIDSMTKNCRIAGIIVSLISVPGILLSGYGVYKEIQ